MKEKKKRKPEMGKKNQGKNKKKKKKTVGSTDPMDHGGSTSDTESSDAGSEVTTATANNTRLEETTALIVAGAKPEAKTPTNLQITARKLAPWLIRCRLTQQEDILLVYKSGTPVKYLNNTFYTESFGQAMGPNITVRQPKKAQEKQEPTQYGPTCSARIPEEELDNIVGEGAKIQPVRSASNTYSGVVLIQYNNKEALVKGLTQGIAAGHEIHPVKVDTRRNLCFNCFEFGHRSARCTKPARTGPRLCVQCGDQHETEQNCNAFRICLSCTAVGKTGTGHGTFFPRCPAAAQYQAAVLKRLQDDSSRKQQTTVSNPSAAPQNWPTLTAPSTTVTSDTSNAAVVNWPHPAKPQQAGKTIMGIINLLLSSLNLPQTTLNMLNTLISNIIAPNNHGEAT